MRRYSARPSGVGFTFWLATFAAYALGAPLPSCEAETASSCVGEGLDLSAEGISACLTALEGKSESCMTYLTLMEVCTAELSEGGVCFAAKMDGEAIPCVVQRTKPEDLSEECRHALPKDDLKGLAKFWADGKRPLDINEIADLNADDKDTYNRWQKKKKGKKTDRDRERDYAVKVAKRERVESLIADAIKGAVAAGTVKSVEEAMETAAAAAKRALDEDLTGTLKPFSKPQLHAIAKKTFSSAKSEL